MHYEVIQQPAGLPVSLETVKMHLRLDETDNYENNYLTKLIKSVAAYGEKCTDREFLTKTFIAYTDCLYSGLEIEKSKLQSIDKIEYYLNGELKTLPESEYSIIKNNIYSRIFLKSSPFFVDERPQAVQITFKAGFGDSDSDIPEDLSVAMLHHIAKIYESRGDAEENRGAMASVITSNLPLETLQVYSKYKIEDISL